MSDIQSGEWFWQNQLEITRKVASSESKENGPTITSKQLNKDKSTYVLVNETLPIASMHEIRATDVVITINNVQEMWRPILSMNKCYDGRWQVKAFPCYTKSTHSPRITSHLDLTPRMTKTYWVLFVFAILALCRYKSIWNSIKRFLRTSLSIICDFIKVCICHVSEGECFKKRTTKVEGIKVGTTFTKKNWQSHCLLASAENWRQS